MHIVLSIILTTINPAIRRVFILYIGLTSIRGSLHSELQPFQKLVYLSDEIALMFFVPIIFQLLQYYFQKKAVKRAGDVKSIDTVQITFSILFYSIVSAINGHLTLIILIIGYVGSYLCYLLLKLLKQKKFYLKHGPSFFGFFIYIVSLILISDQLGPLPIERVFLIIILPRIAYENIFSTLSKSKSNNRDY